MAPTRGAPTSHQFPAVPAEFAKPFNALRCHQRWRLATARMISADRTSGNETSQLVAAACRPTSAQSNQSTSLALLFPVPMKHGSERSTGFDPFHMGDAVRHRTLAPRAAIHASLEPHDGRVCIRVSLTTAGLRPEELRQDAVLAGGAARLMRARHRIT